MVETANRPAKGAPLLDAERRKQIVAYVEAQNGATVAELSERFGVSEATARRDLVLLSRRG